jgi:hypothetical protein
MHDCMSDCKLEQVQNIVSSDVVGERKGRDLSLVRV